MPSFADRLRTATAATGSLLCLGLDPAGAAGAGEAERHCRRLLDACIDQVCAVKPNLAFFEQLGSPGYRVLEGLRAAVPADRLLVLDGKRGDIGSTAEAYARALFDVLGADAVTVNPLMGGDAVEPFLTRPGRGAYLVARSSNPGAAELLDRRLAGGATLAEAIVAAGSRWDAGRGSVGFVVGATAPEAIARVRRAAPAAPLLVPGVGAQGGSLTEAVRAGLDAAGAGLLIPVSRAIASAPAGPGEAARVLRQRLDEARAAAAGGAP